MDAELQCEVDAFFFRSWLMAATVDLCLSYFHSCGKMCKLAERDLALPVLT